MFGQHRDCYPEQNVVFQAAAITAAPNAVTFGTQGARGLIVVIDTTAGCDAGTSLTVTIKGVAYPNGKTPGATAVKWTILASAALVANTSGTPVVLQVSPDLGDSPNTMKEALLPDVIEISAAHGNSDAITYTVTAILTP